MTDKPSRRVPATYAAKNFGALVDRVREEQATYVVESHGVPVAQIAPPTRRTTLADLARFFVEGPRLPPEALDSIEQVSRELRALPERISVAEAAASRTPPVRRNKRR